MLQKITSPKLMNLIYSETPQRKSNIMFRKDSENENFMYILCFENNALITLNRIALRIFEMCDGKTSVKTIAESLKEEDMEVSPEEILEYTLFCIRDMQNKGVLYLGNPGIIKELGIVQ